MESYVLPPNQLKALNAPQNIYDFSTTAKICFVQPFYNQC